MVDCISDFYCLCYKQYLINTESFNQKKVKPTISNTNQCLANIMHKLTSSLCSKSRNSNIRYRVRKLGVTRPPALTEVLITKIYANYSLRMHIFMLPSHCTRKHEPRTPNCSKSEKSTIRDYGLVCVYT